MNGRAAKILIAAAAVLALAGCGGELQTPGEALRIFGEDLPRAFVGEKYQAQVRAVGGLRPFTYEVEAGELPPGLGLEGGVIRGTPAQTGSFEFTVAVSDANLSRTFRDYSMTVTERPPPELRLVAPQTEVRGPTALRLRVDNANELRALSTVLKWDERLFELAVDSPSSAGSGTTMFWQSEPGRLHLELAALGDDWNGERLLATFTLVPREPAVPRLSVEAVFLDDRGGRHHQAAPGRETTEQVEDAGADEPDEGAPQPGQAEPESQPAPGQPEPEPEPEPGEEQR